MEKACTLHLLADRHDAFNVTLETKNWRVAGRVQAEYPAASPDEAITVAKDIYQKGEMSGLASFAQR